MTTDAMPLDPRPDNTDGSTSVTPFFPVSLLKLSILSVCSLGFYEMYWFYRNWHLIKRRESLDIWPMWRAGFAVFYCYQCFSRIRDYKTSKGDPESLPVGILAVAWIVTMLAQGLPGPYAFLDLLSFLFIIPVQAQANRVNAEADPQHDQNVRFSALNWATVVIGSLIIALALTGSFMPVQHY